MKLKSNFLSIFAVFALSMAATSTVWAAQRTLTSDGNGGYYINMPTTGTDELEIPEDVTTFKVYDDGGPSATFTVGSDGYLLLTAPKGRLLRVSGSIKTNYYTSIGYLTVYDGADANANEILYDYGYAPNLRKKLSTQENMFLRFRGEGTYMSNAEGLELTITVVDPNGPHAINIAASENGGFLNPPTTAKPGDVVTLTATPDAGYILNKVVIQDENFEYEYESNVNVIRGSWYSNNEVSFVMPQTDVSITPYFEDLASGYFYLSIDQSRTENMIIPNEVKTFSVSVGYSSERIDSYVTITAPEGKILQVIGEVSGRTSADSLYIYNDVDTLLEVSKKTNIGSVLVSSRNLTIHYKENEKPTNYGYGLSLAFLVVDPDKDYAISLWDYSNGSVVCNTTSAKVNTPVTLSATPKSGYYLHHVRVVGEQTGIDVSKTGGTWYSEGNEVSFLMPGENVIIEPYFASESQEPSVAVSRYETIRVPVPVGINLFSILGTGVGEWEAAKPWC